MGSHAAGYGDRREVQVFPAIAAFGTGRRDPRQAASIGSAHPVSLDRLRHWIRRNVKMETTAEGACVGECRWTKGLCESGGRRGFRVSGEKKARTAMIAKLRVRVGFFPWHHPCHIVNRAVTWARARVSYRNGVRCRRLFGSIASRARLLVGGGLRPRCSRPSAISLRWLPCRAGVTVLTAEDSGARLAWTLTTR